MLDNLKKIIANQFNAAMGTLHRCIVECPESMWHANVAINPFSQSAFHALFFADLYLGLNIHEQPEQAFHKQHQIVFNGYEQMQQVKPVKTYDREFILEYLQFCRDKADRVLESETSQDLMDASGFPWIESTRSEVHLYNIRHIQHHAAQLILRLRLDSDVDVPWFRSGWSLPTENAS